MVDSKELMDYISAARNSGQTDESIRLALKQSGWPDDLINQALNPETETKKFKISPKIWKTTVFVVVLAVLAVGGFKGYTYFTSNPTKVWADTSRKMLNIRSARFSFEASYSEKAEASKDSFFNFFSGDLKFSLSGQGVMRIAADQKDADYDMSSTLASKLGSLNISFGFESRKIGDFVYYKLDGNPLGALFGGGDSSEKPKWAKINLKDSEYKDFALLDTQKGQLLEAFKKAKIMSPTTVIGSENVGGVSTWHYQASLDKQELKNYFEELFKIADAEESDFKEINEIIDRIEFKKLELWIGKSDHLIHQALIETSAPSVFSASMSSATNKAHDAIRLANIRQIQTALELYFNDNGYYPKAVNGEPSKTDGKHKFTEYLFIFPQAPTPPDGNCTEENNKFVYEQLNNGKDYKLTFCLGYDAGGFKAGIMQANPSAITTIIPSNTGELSELEGVPFGGTIMVKINLSDFDSNVKIEEPEGAADVPSVH